MRRGFTLIELTISLVVGAILMVGMLPLVRMAATSGTAAQLQLRDVMEVQSLVERLNAWSAQTNVAAIEAALGNPGEKTGIEPAGDFYLHSINYVYFDDSGMNQTTNGVMPLLGVQVGRSRTGPSLYTVLGNE
jgi:prepilin-type N-terminal cleavage/methylation domain-containing protein